MGPFELTALGSPRPRTGSPNDTPPGAHGFPQAPRPPLLPPRLEAAVVTTLQDQVFLERNRAAPTGKGIWGHARRSGGTGRVLPAAEKHLREMSRVAAWGARLRKLFKFRNENC